MSTLGGLGGFVLPPFEPLPRPPPEPPDDDDPLPLSFPLEEEPWLLLEWPELLCLDVDEDMA